MTALAAIALLIWIYLIFGHGRFWQSGPRLRSTPPPASPASPDSEGRANAAPVAVVVPARDEADTIEATLRSLVAQDYPGPLHIVLVDDESTDDTAARARALGASRVTVVNGAPRPPGWSGKLWAVAQGVARAERSGAELILLTDADIVHEPSHISALVARLQAGKLDLISEMVSLACEGLAERILVPAFVYFFQLLYPFERVNGSASATAAAAGGTILIRQRALARIGGIAAIRGALIDDVALAREVKRGGPIWLGHSALARSVRRYTDVTEIWRMIARTAYVQLRYSPSLLVICVAGMALTFLIPPVAALGSEGAGRGIGALAWLAMSGSYIPTLRRFGLPIIWAPLLPLVAGFYTAATIGSALGHHFGRGVVWKRRAYGRATSG